MNDLHPVALFRLAVLGPLVSREHLEHGELKRLLRDWPGVTTISLAPTATALARSPLRPGTMPGGATGLRR